MQCDARTAYIFQCDGEELFAVSSDKAGANIPRSSCTGGWLLRQEFQLGTHHSRHECQGLLHLARPLLGAKNNTLAGSENPSGSHLHTVKHQDIHRAIKPRDQCATASVLVAACFRGG